MMSPPWASILLYLIVLSSTIGYKLPLPDQPFLTGLHSRGEYSSTPPVWEWETQDKSDKTLLTLIRMARDISDKKKTPDKKPDIKYPSKAETVSKSPLKKFPEVTPKIVLPSKAPYTKPQIMAHLGEDETKSSIELNPTLTEEEKIGAETTQTDKSQTLTIKTTATQMKFTSTQEQFSTPSPTKANDLSVFTNSTADEVTTFGQIISTKNNDLSSIAQSSSNAVVDDTTSVVSSKIPDATPSKPILTSAEPTTHGKTTGWIPDSEGTSTIPAPMTHISTTLEDKILTQSLLRQCMLAILILSVVCTVFIITTIALAAKLCTIRQKQKLRHPATYTEMRCISTLLPESDQQNKVKPKRLKTFANMEESDGDNTTLNSFLPDH